VRSVVVQDYVDIQPVGNGPVNMPQEADEVDSRMAALDLADHFPRGDIQGCEQRRRAVSPVLGML